MRTLKAGQFCPHLPPFGSNNSIQAFFPTFSPKGLKANGQKALFTFPKTVKLHAKNQKILSRGFPEKHSETERQRDRDGPEFKGPPDAIAKPSDQKTQFPGRWRRDSIHFH